MSVASVEQVGRVAFITPEFPTEKPTGGGVGNYVFKMATALTDQNIEVEVFVLSGSTEFLEFRGIRVHRVAASRSLLLRALQRGFAPIIGTSGAAMPLLLVNANRLARALERRHQDRPFDVVQSSNYHSVGAFVRSIPGRRHLIRLSTSRRLYDSSGHLGQRLSARWLEKWDVSVLRGADRVYAPSKFLAGYFKQCYNLDVKVLRPPAELGAGLGSRPGGLPQRYLVHFGSLGSRKGSDTIARALPQAWASEPELHMVWAGSIAPGVLSKYRALWGANARKVVCLGPLAKPTLYRVVADAAASVLPSVVDNLPNTVIESLLLHVPVIGSRGASIDELVVDGVSGVLVPIGDAGALANAMVVAWQGKAPWHASGFRPPDLFDEMRPDEALRRFLKLAAESHP